MVKVNTIEFGDTKTHLLKVSKPKVYTFANSQLRLSQKLAGEKSQASIRRTMSKLRLRAALKAMKK